MNRNYDPSPRFFNIGYEPTIGHNCSLVNTLFDCAAPITIGDNVATGHDVLLLTAKHDYTKYAQERLTTVTANPIVIKDGVWIASRAVICGGVTIGNNSVIGANSLVLENVGDNQMWCGTPARFVKNI